MEFQIIITDPHLVGLMTVCLALDRSPRLKLRSSAGEEPQSAKSSGCSTSSAVSRFVTVSLERG